MRALAASLCLLAGLLLVALTTGERPIPVAGVIAALTGMGEAPAETTFIVTTLRLPRALMAMAVGGALAVAGAIAQAAMRNPLAEPGLIGINGGASLAVMAVIVIWPGLAAHWLQWFAFAGAMAMVGVIQALSARTGMRSRGIILIGIGLGALTGGLSGLLSVLGDVTALQRAMLWMAGSLQNSRWDRLAVLSLWLGPLMAGALLMARQLDLAGFGDDVIRAVGRRAGRLRAGLMLACALIAGAAIAATGPIGFVGLMAPHVARGLVGPLHRRSLPLAAVTGACLLIAADTLGRSILAPAQIPAGIVTALLGAPFFGWLMWSRRND